MKLIFTKEDEIILSKYNKKIISEIKNAIKNNTPIIIKGSQAPTGKTTLYNLLKKYNVTVYEEYECCVINLDKILN